MKPANWMRWDIDSRSGTKMSIFFARHKAIGYGFFLVLVEMLYRAESNRIELSDAMLDGLIELCGLTASRAQGGDQSDPSMQTDARAYAKQLLHDLTMLGLMVLENGQLSSPRVDAELALNEERRRQTHESRRAAANARWSKQLPKPDSSNAPACTSNAPACTSNAKHAKEEKRKEKERRVLNTNINATPHKTTTKFDPSDLRSVQFPIELQDVSAHKALADWLEYKRLRKQNYKTVDSVHRLLAHWAKQPYPVTQFVEAVDQAIRNNWSGLHPVKPDRNGSGNYKAPNERAWDRSMETLRELEAEEQAQQETLILEVRE